LEATLIRWIQDHKWLSSLLISAFALLFFGGIDTLAQGFLGLAASSILAISIVFAAKLPQLSIALVIAGTITELVLGLTPLAGGLSAAFSLFLTAAFAKRLWYFISLGLTIISGLAVTWFNTFGVGTNQTIYGLNLQSELSKTTAFITVALLVVSGNILFWLLGRLAITYEVYVGTEFDRALSAETQAKLSLEVAEQNERFEIARDINELTIQKVTAVISQAEGGAYAAKADAGSALRSLERVAQSARAAHTELRRLYDMLNKTHSVTAAPPGLDELNALAVTYREFGFNVSISHEGARFSISEGAGLAIYRIVFDALENVKKHCLVGTDVAVDFSWVEEGMQVLVKDNGIEVSRRADVSLELEDSGYTAEDDIRSLVETIQGAGLTAMRERASLYGGNIEATRVPGVGFTVSAIFPHLRSVAGTRN
jgi:signal transduction histidine kinase